MYAIINIAGKQYKTSKGQNIRVPKIDKELGTTFKVDEVLFIDDGNSVHIGKPNLKEASVTASIVMVEIAKYLYKEKEKKGYQRKNGHRQDFTEIEITDAKFSSSSKKESKN